MIVLSLDTSSHATSCALVELGAGGEVAALAESLHLPPARAGELLPAALASLCAQAGRQLSHVSGMAVGIGPGSFTGLRVGLASAKGLCYARRWPLRGASSLEALALAAWDGHPHGTVLVPALEARRGELFVAAFAPLPGVTGEDAGRPPRGLTRLRADAVLQVAEVPGWLRGLPGAPLLAGPGARQNRAALLAAGVPEASLERAAGGSAGAGTEARAWPTALAVAVLAARTLREATYDAPALFALAPDYLTPSEPEKALAEGRVGKLPGVPAR